MKKLFLCLIIFLPFAANAQILGFHENFEPLSNADSMVASGPGAWTINTRIAAQGVQCDSNYVVAADSSFLITSPFSTVSNSFVILHFSHICKIELLDIGEVAVSVNNGPWIKLTGTQYINPGSSQFVTMGNKFNANSYPVDWQSTQNSVKPTNAWWKEEQFDISLLVGNQPNVRIRFKLADGNGNGANQARGWYIDNIRVIMSFSELNPPTITYVPPIYLGTAYNLGPFDIRARMQDQSGIQEGKIFYKINNGTLDSVLMTVYNNDTLHGFIPAVNDLDTIDYYVRAKDASPAHNTTLNPTSGFRRFVATSGIHFPYIDNFDGPNTLFYDTSYAAGTNWELGTPAYGMTNTAHSPPNSWDINLNMLYGTSANCMLYTPVFDFSTVVNAKMTFWMNYNIETYYDGIGLEYTPDGTNWYALGTVGDPNSVNWFNTTSVTSSNGKPVWTGTSGGWTKCEYTLSQLNNAVGPVQFRFVFTSYIYYQSDGVSIDDFMIIPPYTTDAGANSSILPDMTGCVPAGNNTFMVDVKNYGSQKIAPPLRVAYKLDGLPIVIDSIITDTIYPGALDTLTFAIPLVVSPGNHTIKLFTQLPGDLFHGNDTVTYSFVAYSPLPLPYYNALDAASSLNDFCIQTGTYGRAFYDASAANTGAGGVILDASNTIGWSYPDTTIGSLYYVWDQSMDASHAATMRLIVNTAGLSMVRMKFDAKLLYLWDEYYTHFRVTVNGTMITNHMMPPGMTTGYDTYEYDLSSFLPATSLVIEFQSKVYYPYNYTVPNGNGIFLDNIMVFEPPSQEAYLINVTTPTSGCGLGMEPVTIHVKNTGSDTIAGNLSASYKLDPGAPVITEPIPYSIFPGDTITYVFATPANLTVTTTDSVFNTKTWVTLTGDPFHFNDTVYKDIKSMFIPNDPVIPAVIVIPYATDTLLHAASTGTVYWYDSPTSTNYLLMGPDYQTPVLYDTTSYYLEARNGAAGTDFYVGNGTINNGTFGYPCPFGFYYNGAREQMLVLASELSAAGIGPGPIQSVAFDVISPAGGAMPNFTVKIGHTNVNNLTTWVTTGLTQVYYNSALTNTVGWNELLISPVFVWDGVSNIIVETCFDNYPNGYTTNASLNQTATSFTSTLDYHTDGGNVCPPVSPPYINPYSQRPNMKFKATSSGCPSNRVSVEVQVSSIPAIDAGVVSFTAPTTAVNLTMEPVSVKVHNFGTAPVTNFPISYKVGANSVVTETFTGTIQPGDTVPFNFTAQANLTVHQTYSIKSWTSVTGDNYPINDTAYTSVENQLPVYCISGATSTGDDDITHVYFSNINNNSPTPYNGTYTNYTNLAPAQVYLSATYPISVGIGFYSTYGYAGYCEVYIDYNADGVFTEPDEVVFGSAYASTPLNQNLTGNVTIPPTATAGITRMRVVAVESGNAASVHPCGTFSYGETEDYSVYISPLLHKDIGLLGFASPNASESQNMPLTVSVIAKNFGLDTLHNFNITWTFNNGTPQVYNWSGALAPAAKDTVDLGQVTIDSALNSFLAYTTLTGDSNTYNDTTRTHCFGLPPISLYLDNFNAALSNWTISPSALWQHGVPTSTVINSAHSPTMCWKTRLNGNYLNNRNDYLYSPTFNFTTITGAVMRFFHWWEAEPLDGGNIQYTTNSGTTWITLGYQNDPNAVEWYNAFVNGTVLWNGEWGGWKESIYNLAQFDHQAHVQFRFHFYSNASLNAYNGWAVDDFEIRVPKIPKDAGVSSITTPTSTVGAGFINPVITIHNFGLDTLLNIPVAYVATGMGMIVEYWNGHLPPDSSIVYTFSNHYASPSSSYTFCSFTAIGNDYYKFNDSTCLQVQYNIGIEQLDHYGFMLDQNVPNPADNLTTIRFYIPENGKTHFTVTNIYGQNIIEKDAETLAGSHDIILPLTSLAPGVYFYSLEFKGQRMTRKMVVEK